MNIYDRIINILLEARIEDYLERLDEARYESGKKVKAGKPKKGGSSPNVKMVIRDLRAKTGQHPLVKRENPEETPEELMLKRIPAHIKSRGQKKPKP